MEQTQAGDRNGSGGRARPDVAGPGEPAGLHLISIFGRLQKRTLFV